MAEAVVIYVILYHLLINIIITLYYTICCISYQENMVALDEEHVTASLFNTPENSSIFFLNYSIDGVYDASHCKRRTASPLCIPTCWKVMAFLEEFLRNLILVTKSLSSTVTLLDLFVLQGWILILTFFLIFINDLSDVTSSQLGIYVDDTTI